MIPDSPQLLAFVTRFRQNLADAVRIDTRSLAVFRVFVGLLILADLALRSRNFAFYYTDDGVMPQSLAESMTPENAFSVFFFTADPALIALLWVIHALVAIQLIVGYKTRLATIVSFLFVISLDYHNPAVTSYADVLFRLLLFWAIFLPLGERWSVDAVLADRDSRASVTGIASALILGQMVYMYVINGLHKTEDNLWLSGEATPLIMGLDDMTFLLAEPMRAFPTLLQLGGLTWFYMLLGGWLLILLWGRPRYLLVFCFMVAHASFAITVRIGAFAYVALAGLTLFLQAPFWDDLEGVRRRVGIDHDRVTPVIARLKGLARRIPPLRIDDNRYRQAKSGVYSLALGAVALSMVLFLVLTHTPLGGVAQAQGTSDRIDDQASMVNVDQPDWTVFAPTPRTTDRYYVFPAQTAEGDLIDVYNERPLTYDRPGKQLQEQYDTYRMRFYMNSVRRAADSGGEGAHTELLEYYCTDWAEANDLELTHINMWAVHEDITLDSIDDPDERETRYQHLTDYACGDHEPMELQPPEE